MYKKNDILEKNGYFKKVLGVCDELYFLSYSSGDINSDDLKRCCGSYTEHQLTGWKLHSRAKEPFIPTGGDIYWTFESNGVCEATWDGGGFCSSRLANGFVFRTKEEAVSAFTATKELLKKL